MFRRCFMARYNPYRVLGVSSLSKLEDIRKEYKHLVKVYHPDNIETGDIQKFREVSKAWKFIQENHTDKLNRSKEYMWRHKTLFKIYKEVYKC